MAALTDNLTHARLLELLTYNPSTGLFTWNVRRGGDAKKGSVAGSPNSDGYIQIKIDGVLHKAHRLAILYVTGKFPTDQVDHRQGVRSDNRLSKLREADATQNACNRKIRRTNRSGVSGIHWDDEAWAWNVRVCYRGKRVLVGRFKCFDEAVAARMAAVVKMQGEFAGECRDGRSRD